MGSASGASGFEPHERAALDEDARDPLSGFRSRFAIPQHPDGTPKVYMCGNSLGLQPLRAVERVQQELSDWARLAVDGHFEGRNPWYSYHEQFRESGARLVGAVPGEVVMMNSLTVNLHLMLVSFYRPTPDRHRILVEDCTFPSDTYAVKSQLRFHGYDPAEGLIVVRPREGESTIRTETIEEVLEQRGSEIALILLGGLNYFTGQLFDMQRIAAAGRRQGCVIGFDLAHAAGNAPLQLHDWGVDFAVWCSYKYLNSGPGAVGGCFVHESRSSAREVPRFAGWWGNDPQRRFRMHLEPEFQPVEGAEGWQLSNPPILAMAPLAASLELFEEAGSAALRSKSERLTAYLEYRIDRVGDRRLEQLTPRDPRARGCQISLRALERPRQLFEALRQGGVIGDYREPDVVRLAPVPLYNSFHDVWRVGQLLEQWSAAG